MAIDVEWDNAEKTIMRWDFKGHWTPAEWHAAANRSVELRSTAMDIPRVTAILNLEQGGPVPMNILPHARVAMEMLDERDYVIITHGSGFVRSMVNVFRHLNPTLGEKILVTETVEDARTIIQSQGFPL